MVKAHAMKLSGAARSAVDMKGPSRQCESRSKVEKVRKPLVDTETRENRRPSKGNEKFR